MRSILSNPAIAGQSVYKGSVVGNGDWSPIVSEDTWRAVTGILNDPARKPPKGVRTLLGGLAKCSCGNVIQGCPTTLHVPGYRCQPSTRENRSVTHVATAAAPVDEYVEAAVIGILSKPDAVSLFTREDSAVDIAGLQERKLAIRTRLDQLAADYAAGIIERSALIAATERGRAEIAAADAELADAGRGNVYDGLIGAGDVQAVWVRLDSSRKRAVIDAMMRVTLSPWAGAGGRSRWRISSPSRPEPSRQASFSFSASLSVGQSATSSAMRFLVRSSIDNRFIPAEPNLSVPRSLLSARGYCIKGISRYGVVAPMLARVLGHVSTFGKRV